MKEHDDVISEQESEDSFDKFMDEILIKESKSVKSEVEETSQRVYAKKRNSHPLSKIRVLR